MTFKYHGTFYQDGDTLMTLDGGAQFLDTLNDPEQGEFYFLTTKEGIVASEVWHEPVAFSFIIPYKLWSAKSLPENFNEYIGNMKFDGESFTEYFRLGAWKYNCDLSIHKMRIAALAGDASIDLEALREFEEEVRKYNGEGPRPVFTN